MIFDFSIDYQITLTPAIIRSVNSIMDVPISRAVRACSGLRAAELRATQEKHLAFIAHDLRSPLHAISSCVALSSSTSVDGVQGEGLSKLIPMLE